MSQINTDKVYPCLEKAKDLAYQLEHRYILTEHLLMSLLSTEVVEVLKAVDCDVNMLIVDIRTYLNSGMVPPSVKPSQLPVRTEVLTRIIQRAVMQVQFESKLEVLPIDILLSILQEDTNVCFASYFLAKQGITYDKVKSYSNKKPIDAEMSSDDAVAILKQFCINLNELAIEGNIDPLIGRDDELEAVIKITARRTKNNLIIVGEPGIGKTAIVEGLARRIVEGQVPEIIKDSTVWSLDIGALMAGTKFRGDMEDRMKLVLKALESVKKPFLFIDEIHMIMGAGSNNTGSIDVANLLKPALARGKLRCIGSTTLEEYRKHIEKDRAILRRFHKLDVFEPSIEDAKSIIFGLKSKYEEFHGVTYLDEAIITAVELSAKYVQGRLLPDKAIDIIDAAGAAQRVKPEDQKISIIDKFLIEHEISKMAKIPESTIHESEAEKLSHLEATLLTKIYGQDKAVVELSDAIILARSGLKELNKPMGSFLLTGPTGTGKTELSKQLALSLGVPLIKYDMSEYMESHSVSKMIGSPPGYVGYQDGTAGSGKLISDIETHPSSVLLLDEIEKAHPDVLNILLQIMDDGRLTSSNGKTVLFNNVILLMTSNAGAFELQKNSIGFGDNSRQGEDNTVINRTFSPEFRNRLDGIIKFNALSQDNCIKIVEKFINDLNALVSERKVSVTLTDNAKEWLVKNGFDPKMGARPLDRIITETIKRPLSKEMLFGKLKEGGSVLVDVNNEALTLNFV